MDEAKRHQLNIDERRLSKELGIPVVPTSARKGEGMESLLQSIHEVANGLYKCKPHRIISGSKPLKSAVSQLVKKIESRFVGISNARWVALRLLEGDPRIVKAVKEGELDQLNQSIVISEKATEYNANQVETL
jgi:ferrous iron transport protein B